MKKIIRQFALFILLLGFYACKHENKKIVQKEIPQFDSLQGVWELLTYQDQDDTVFRKMEGINIKKINCNGHWMSVAYKTKNNKAVHIAGGTYKYKNGVLFEKIEYHMKNLACIGDINVFNVKYKGDTIYVSGRLKEGTSDEYKIEEYWVKLNAVK